MVLGKSLHEPNEISREDPSKSLQQNLNPLPALGLKTHSNLLKMERYLTQAQFWSYFGSFTQLLKLAWPIAINTYFQEGTIHGSTWF